MKWWKGNLHTHTDLSDGDSPPGQVARWYDEAGYDFLAISDHNVRFDPGDLQQELRAEGRELRLLPAEELSAWWQGIDRVHALHVNGYGTNRQLGPADGESVTEVLQQLVDRVLDDGGWASVNHPNFWSSISVDQLLAIDRLTFLEIYNGHPLTFSSGSVALPSVELMWDVLLVAGRRILGLAVDDAHYFQAWSPDLSNPGRGWVSVAAESATEIYPSLVEGRFYASTGPVLERLTVSPGEEIRLTLREPALIEFVADGRLVAASDGSDATFPLGDFSYLRARITNSSGTAWVQPIFAS